MKISRRFSMKWVVLAVLILIIALALARALNKRAVKRDAASAAVASAQKAPLFELLAQDVLNVQPLSMEQTVQLSGSLKALQTAIVKVRAAGQVQGLDKREGDTVRAGEVLARIDNTEALARLRQASEQARAAQEQLHIAQRTAQNNQALLGQGFISTTALQTSNNNLAAAQANHQSALAARDLAQKALADTIAHAPLSGQVSARWVQNGEMVVPDTRLMELVDLSAFEMEAALAPADAAAVQPDQPVSLKVEGLAQPVPARVARINPSVQAGSRNVLVYLHVPAAPGMRQGLFAQGHLITGQVRTLALPPSAVRNDKPQPYVQVLRNGHITHQAVTLGARGMLNGQPVVAIESGLTAGAQVLRAQAGLIADGTAVHLKSPPAQASNAAAPAVSGS